MIACDIKAMELIIKGKGEITNISAFKRDVIIREILSLRGIKEEGEVFNNRIINDIWSIIKDKRGIKGIGIGKEANQRYKQ